jgi:hypothetical protein
METPAVSRSLLFIFISPASLEVLSFICEVTTT